MKGKHIEKVLVTGGAGFIGSHTVDLLVDKGYEVTILDNLEAQVHQEGIPEYLNEKAKFVRGDVRDRRLLHQLVEDVDAILHLAAIVGVGQSMYQIERYIDCNTRGTATLFDTLVNKANSVKKLVVASSMSVYGEGTYFCENCGDYRYPGLRSKEQLANKMWDPLCPVCKQPLKPLPTNEDRPLKPTYIYAMSKTYQEDIGLLIGKTYGIPTVLLRYWNTYGPRQCLGNPYTGVCTIFCTRVLNNNPPYIFEDGNQLRDFVHVNDVARANVLALERNSANYHAINVGTGKPVSIKQMAELLLRVYGSGVRPYISQKYRKGDVRHCYPNITKAQELLGYKPSVTLEEGLRSLINWASTRVAADLFDESLRELKEKRLV